jgi:hypothetical protein
VTNVLLIGGAPSSGSTLLVNLLARHEGLLCLPETGLFAHGRNIVDLAASPEARTDLGWHLPWLLTGHKVAGALGWDSALYENAGSSYRTAFDLLRAHVKVDANRTLVEKTPENVFAFREYLSISPSNRVIVTSRELLGVVQSLVRRGFTILEAFLAWFSHSYETLRLLSEFPDQVFHCRYAELTSAPDHVVGQILGFVGSTSVRGSNGFATSSRAEDVGLRTMLDVSSWKLTDNAWSLSPSDTPISNPARNLIGLDYEMSRRLLLFKPPETSLLSPTTLDDALKRGRPIEPDEATRGSPVESDLSSMFTRILAEHYVPHLRST